MPVLSLTKQKTMINVKRLFAGTIMLICWLPIALLAQDISIENMPPVVVKTVPQSGDSNVDSNLSEIKVTYSKDMADGSWSITQVAKENFPQIKEKPKYLADKRTCVMKVSLEPNKTYAIWLNTERYKNFKDTNQSSAIPYLLVFKTREE